MSAVVRMKTSPERRALNGKVHIAKKALGLEDEDYRAILSNRYGRMSSADLSDTQLVDLVEHFKSLGFKPQKKAPAKAGPRRQAQGAEHRKIRALWLSLYNLGIVDDPSETALAAFAKRVSGGKAKGVDALQWVHGENSLKTIEALKSWAAREGRVHWVQYKDRAGNLIGYNDRGRVIEAQLRILRSLELPITFIDVHRMTESEGDRLIALQGEQIRRGKAARR